MLPKENIPLRCPLFNHCKESYIYKECTVRHIKANSMYFLNNPDEMWKLVRNCPHMVEDAFWIGVIGEEDWLRYLSCEEFSKWFWEKKRVQRQVKNAR
jgi:hypothetical protein